MLSKFGPYRPAHSLRSLVAGAIIAVLFSRTLFAAELCDLVHTSLDTSATYQARQSAVHALIRDYPESDVAYYAAIDVLCGHGWFWHWLGDDDKQCVAIIHKRLDEPAISMDESSARNLVAASLITYPIYYGGLDKADPGGRLLNRIKAELMAIVKASPQSRYRPLAVVSLLNLEIYDLGKESRSYDDSRSDAEFWKGFQELVDSYSRLLDNQAGAGARKRLRTWYGHTATLGILSTHGLLGCDVSGTPIRQTVDHFAVAQKYLPELPTTGGKPICGEILVPATAARVALFARFAGNTLDMESVVEFGESLLKHQHLMNTLSKSQVYWKTGEAYSRLGRPGAGGLHGARIVAPKYSAAEIRQYGARAVEYMSKGAAYAGADPDSSVEIRRLKETIRREMTARSDGTNPPHRQPSIENRRDANTSPIPIDPSKFKKPPLVPVLPLDGDTVFRVDAPDEDEKSKKPTQPNMPILLRPPDGQSTTSLILPY